MVTIIKNQEVLNKNWIPPEEFIVNRSEEIEKIENYVYRNINNGHTPGNVVCFGGSGTGKTLVNRYLKSKYSDRSTIIYVNCRNLTEFKAVKVIADELCISYRGRDVDEYYQQIKETIRNGSRKIIIVLDEIDTLIKKSGDAILYTLSRMNESFNKDVNVLKESKIKACIGIILITNKVTFYNDISSAVDSSLTARKLFFRNYNANDIKQILSKRIPFAFNDNAFEDGVIEKCSAMIAQEHGDARKALELLHEAALIAEKESLKISIKHLNEAHEIIESDEIFEILKLQSLQCQNVILAIINLCEQNTEVTTGTVYEEYKKLKGSLSMRRVSTFIADLENMGIVKTELRARGGNRGTTKIIYPCFQDKTAEKIKKYFDEQYQ